MAGEIPGIAPYLVERAAIDIDQALDAVHPPFRIAVVDRLSNATGPVPGRSVIGHTAAVGIAYALEIASIIGDGGRAG